MAVERGVVEEQACRLVEQRRQAGTRLREAVAPECRAHLLQALSRRDPTPLEGLEEVGEPVDDAVAQTAELFRIELDWGLPGRAAHVRVSAPPA